MATRTTLHVIEFPNVDNRFWRAISKKGKHFKYEVKYLIRVKTDDVSDFLIPLYQGVDRDFIAKFFIYNGG